MDSKKTIVAPEGWEVILFHYKGEHLNNYRLDDVILVLQKRTPAKIRSVCLEFQGFGFNVLRDRIGLGPSLTTVQEGIDLCLLVAETYLDTPLKEIPGTYAQRTQSMSMPGATTHTNDVGASVPAKQDTHIDDVVKN